jgi:hypothetical protein
MPANPRTYEDLIRVAKIAERTVTEVSQSSSVHVVTAPPSADLASMENKIAALTEAVLTIQSRDAAQRWNPLPQDTPQLFSRRNYHSQDNTPNYSRQYASQDTRSDHPRQYQDNRQRYPRQKYSSHDVRQPSQPVTQQPTSQQQTERLPEYKLRRPCNRYFSGKSSCLHRSECKARNASVGFVRNWGISKSAQYMPCKT